MKPYLNEQCEICSHLGIDHEVQSYTTLTPKLKAICWKCMGLLPTVPNLDSYHSFKFDNLEYLQKLYEEKHKVK